MCTEAPEPISFAPAIYSHPRGLPSSSASSPHSQLPPRPLIRAHGALLSRHDHHGHRRPPPKLARSRAPFPSILPPVASPDSTYSPQLPTLVGDPCIAGSHLRRAASVSSGRLPSSLFLFSPVATTPLDGCARICRTCWWRRPGGRWPELAGPFASPLLGLLLCSRENRASGRKRTTERGPSPAPGPHTPVAQGPGPRG